MPSTTNTAHRTARDAGLLLLVLLAASCQDSAEPPYASELEAQAGDAQVAVAGSAVAEPPAVRVLDQYGVVMAGVVVRFEVTEGGGTIVRADARTDAAGMASPGEWRLGPRAGRNTLTATVAALAPVSFTASGMAGAPARMEIVSGDAQAATVTSELPVPVVVRVTDGNDNPAAGVTVRFLVPANQGGVQHETALTDEFGQAAAGRWTLGSVAGPQRLDVVTQGVPPVTLTALAGPGVAAGLELVSGDRQSAEVGTAVTLPPTVRVIDAWGNAVSGEDVRFLVVSGNGAVDIPQGNTVHSNSDAVGLAQVARWVLGTKAGSNLLRAELVGTAAAVSFTATGEPATPANLLKVDGDGQTAAPGAQVAVAPSVRVTDAHGNGVPAVTVVFAASGDGAVGAASSLTDANGVASAGSWRVGTTTGTQTLSATVAGVPSAQFTATVTATSGGGSGGSGGTGGSGGGGGGGGGSSGGTYDLEVLITGSVSTSHQTAIYMAAGRWAGVIKGDLSDVQVSVPANACGVQHPALTQVIDDLLIIVSVTAIDGPGNILGSAGPCYVRSSGGLPVIGVMHLDVADLSFLETNGRLEDVIAHEIGHIVGIGTRWGTHLAGAGGADPHFTGANALGEFVASGGANYPGNPVPVENTGGPGTRDGHWRESIFNNELMTGWLNMSSNPLSSITIAALQDIGYEVDTAGADGFSIGGSDAASEALTPKAVFEIRERPLGITPVAVDSRGRPVPGNLIRR